MKISQNNYLGVFDSGVGGLTILSSLKSMLPQEQFLYVSDDANAPYGIKSKDEITERCFEVVDFLISKRCKLIVVACNTASTNVIEVLRAKYNIPFIGIEPAIKSASLKSKTKVIGVLATRGTLSSRLFAQTSDNFTQNIRVIEQIGDGLVESIEKGELANSKLVDLLNSYVKPMLYQNIDVLVLGCTHYSFLIPLLKAILPKNIQILDSADAVAKQTFRILKKEHLLSSKDLGETVKYFSTATNSTLLNFIPENMKVVNF
tara:strand:- start:8075 stop:8857 length:783 start_codon:yes stop_codon:yes gene_type:complete